MRLIESCLPIVIRPPTPKSRWGAIVVLNCDYGEAELNLPADSAHELMQLVEGFELTPASCMDYMSPATEAQECSHDETWWVILIQWAAQAARCEWGVMEEFE